MESAYNWQHAAVGRSRGCDSDSGCPASCGRGILSYAGFRIPPIANCPVAAKIQRGLPPALNTGIHRVSLGSRLQPAGSRGLQTKADGGGDPSFAGTVPSSSPQIAMSMPKEMCVMSPHSRADLIGL